MYSCYVEYTNIVWLNVHYVEYTNIVWLNVHVLRVLHYAIDGFCMNIIVLFLWFSTMWMSILLTSTDLLDSPLSMPFVIGFLSVCDWGMGMRSGIMVSRCWDMGMRSGIMVSRCWDMGMRSGIMVSRCWDMGMRSGIMVSRCWDKVRI